MGALFRQTAFKEFTPGHMPTKLRVRFEKKDRSMKTFWVVNPRTFSAVEKVKTVPYQGVRGVVLFSCINHSTWIYFGRRKII